MKEREGLVWGSALALAWKDWGRSRKFLCKWILGCWLDLCGSRWEFVSLGPSHCHGVRYYDHGRCDQWVVLETLSGAVNFLFTVLTSTILEPTQFLAQRSPHAEGKAAGECSWVDYPQSSSEIKNTFTLPYVMCVIKYLVSHDGLVRWCRLRSVDNSRLLVSYCCELKSSSILQIGIRGFPF